MHAGLAAVPLFEHPIHRIPDEILGEIFEFCVLERVQWDNTFRYRLAPWLLTYICRRWRNVSLRTPGLWSYICIDARARPVYGPTLSVDNPVRMLEPLITRSKSAPLHVQVRNAKLEELRIPLIKYLREISPRVVDFEWWCEFDIIEELVGANFSSLRKLELYLMGEYGELERRCLTLEMAEMVNGVFSSATQLRYLDLELVAPHLDLPWSTLETCILTHPSSRIMSRLNYSKIVLLKLDNLVGSMPPYDNIWLPALESLRLGCDTEYTPSLIKFCFKSFIHPNLHTLELATSLQQSRAAPLPQLPLHRAPKLTSVALRGFFKADDLRVFIQSDVLCNTRSFEIRCYEPWTFKNLAHIEQLGLDALELPGSLPAMETLCLSANIARPVASSLAAALKTRTRHNPLSPRVLELREDNSTRPGEYMANKVTIPLSKAYDGILVGISADCVGMEVKFTVRTNYHPPGCLLTKKSHPRIIQGGRYSKRK